VTYAVVAYTVTAVTLVAYGIYLAREAAGLARDAAARERGEETNPG
jgi:hypothetical protein